MAFQSILATSVRTDANGQSPVVPVPAGLNSFTIRIDLGASNQFNDPVNEHLLLICQFSFDGGVTFQDVAGGTIDGSATGTWGKNAAANPTVGGNVPVDPSYPTHARGRYAQTGSFRFGLSIEVI